MNIIKFEVLALPYDGEDEATASALIDNHSMWLKFIFTDDLPNLNGQGVDADEFKNIIRTGLHKPFKKSGVGVIGEGHPDAFPIGTLVDLRHESNQVVAIASVWEDEFPEEAELIRQAYADKNPMNVSWELFFQEVEEGEDGTQWLRGVTTKAATLLSNPAYDGRTPILAIAAEWSTKYINDLPDSAFLYIELGGEKDEGGKITPRSLRHFPYKDTGGKVDLPHLRNAIARIPQADLPADLKSKLQEKARRILAKQEGTSSMDELEKLQKDLDTVKVEREEFKTKLTEAESLLDGLDALKTELDGLRSYKQQVEEEKARAELIEKRLGRFSEAGIEMDKEAFLKDAERWLSLNDEAFEFVLGTLVNSRPASSNQTSVASVVTTETNDTLTLVKEFLRERKSVEEN